MLGIHLREDIDRHSFAKILAPRLYVQVPSLLQIAHRANLKAPEPTSVLECAAVLETGDEKAVISYVFGRLASASLMCRLFRGRQPALGLWQQLAKSSMYLDITFERARWICCPLGRWWHSILVVTKWLAHYRRLAGDISFIAPVSLVAITKSTPLL